MVEGTGLENRQGVTALEGSNPSLSARKVGPSLVLGLSFLSESIRDSKPVR